MHRLCAVILVRDQEFTVTDVVTRSIVAGLDCVLVDDGATPACAEAMKRLSRQDRIYLVRPSQRGGPAGGMVAGLREAQQLGYTHAVRVSADGRDDLSDLPRFVRTSLAAPDALVCGYRTPDARMPRVRSRRERLLRAGVATAALSLALRDPGCAFRIYPLDAVLGLPRADRLGRWPGFEVRVLVRMHWRGQPIYWLPVAARRGPDGPPVSPVHLEHA